VHPGGSAEVPLEVGQAISLAICLPVPLLVSEDFVSAIEAHEGSSAANPPLEVPTAFRQAFDD
jgi:hypothetical protein